MDERRVNFNKRFSFIRMVFWILLTIPAWYFGWLDIVVYVSFLSQVALVLTDYTAWRSDDNPEMKILYDQNVKILKQQKELFEHIDELITRLRSQEDKASLS